MKNFFRRLFSSKPTSDNDDAFWDWYHTEASPVKELKHLTYGGGGDNDLPGTINKIIDDLAELSERVEALSNAIGETVKGKE